MSLITRIGASNSNSFVSLKWARRTLVTLYGDVSAWDALSTDAQEYRMMLAARVIGLLPLRGKRVYRNQALAFPRTVLRPRRGLYSSGSLRDLWMWGGEPDIDQVIYELPDDRWEPEKRCRKIPIEVKTAQCQIAFEVISQTLATGGGTLGQYPGAVTSVSGGGIAVGISPGSTVGNLFDKIFRSSQAVIYLMLGKWLSQVRGGAISAVRDIDFYSPHHTLPTTTTTTTTMSTTTSSTTTTSP